MLTRRSAPGLSILFGLLLSPAAVFPVGESTAALATMQSLSNAMDIFYLDYSAITTLENLDDVKSSPANPDYQSINFGGGALVIEYADGLIRRRNLVGDSFSGPPYLSTGSGTQVEGPDGDYDEGTFLDPWGNPYYFYSPLGLFEPKTEEYSLRYFGDQFDLYTITSNGPDGVPATGDDMAYTTGLPFFTRAVISSAKLSITPSKSYDSTYTLVIRGYLLGGSQGDGEVTVNGVPLNPSNIVWSPTEITALLPYFPGEVSTVKVQTDSGQSTRSLEIGLTFTPLNVDSWELYD